MTAPTPTCYRHPSRPTYVSCSRCARPICPDCMTAAAVGQQCPECVNEGKRSGRQARTHFGRRITPGALVARLSILAVLAYLAGYLSKELLDRVESEAAARQEADERAGVMSGVVRTGRGTVLGASPGVAVSA